MYLQFGIQQFCVVPAARCPAFNKITIGPAALSERGPPHLHIDALQLVRLLWASDHFRKNLTRITSAVHEVLQHSQHTDIVASDGIRTHNLSRLAIAEPIVLSTLDRRPTLNKTTIDAAAPSETGPPLDG
jgi:hypothetical protein